MKITLTNTVDKVSESMTYEGAELTAEQFDRLRDWWRKPYGTAPYVTKPIDKLNDSVWLRNNAIDGWSIAASVFNELAKTQPMSPTMSSQKQTIERMLKELQPSPLEKIIYDWAGGNAK